jgi:hypothetical protein
MEQIKGRGLKKCKRRGQFARTVRGHRQKIQHSLAKVAPVFYICSRAAVPKETAELSASVEAVPPTAPRNRSIGNEGRGAGEGRKKEFVAPVPDNLLISPVARSKMEGIGANFGRFGSSPTRPGRVHDASLNLRARGWRPRLLAGILPGSGAGCSPESPEMAPQRLEKIESAPGNGMASETSNPKIW